MTNKEMKRKWEWVKENVRFGDHATNFSAQIFNLYNEYEKVLKRKSKKLYKAEITGIEVLKEMIKTLEEGDFEEVV